MKLLMTSKEDFISAITDDPADKFAKTFVSKANMGNYWEHCLGAWSDDEEELMGAIIVTISKRKPHVANLQLLHTFAKHRRKGVGKELCKYSLYQLWWKETAQYMRVSSEIPARPFYESIGFKFLGVQKSGCFLSMFKITNKNYKYCKYDINDPIIQKAVFKKGKGGCVEVYDKPKDLFS